MIEDHIIVRRRWEKRLPVGHPAVYGRTPCVLKAEAKLYSLGNQAPYFSLTGELWRNNGRTLDSCGQMGDLLVKEWPQLEIIELLHLSDEHGVPMHAVANGAYWLGFSKYQELDLKAFARLWRVSTSEATEAYEYVKAQRTPRTEGMSYNPGSSPKESLSVLAYAMLPRWQAEADDGLALLKGVRD